VLNRKKTPVFRIAGFLDLIHFSIFFDKNRKFWEPALISYSGKNIYSFGVPQKELIQIPVPGT
jgi:hypothetical protein